MLKYKEGVDILSDLGGVKTIAQAQEIFRQKLNPEHQKRLAAITCEEALLRVANAIALCDPDNVFIHTGSDEDMATVRKLSLEKGEEKELAIKGHTYHFDLPEDQGRIVAQTFYIVNEDEGLSSLAKKEP